MTVRHTFPHKLDIHVTDSDLHWGCDGPCSFRRHPLALAAYRAAPACHFVFYLNRRIEFLTDGGSLRALYRLSSEAQKFVRDYSHERLVSPATFTLTLTHTWDE